DLLGETVSAPPLVDLDPKLLGLGAEPVEIGGFLDLEDLEELGDHLGVPGGADGAGGGEGVALAVRLGAAHQRCDQVLLSHPPGCCVGSGSGSTRNSGWRGSQVSRARWGPSWSPRWRMIVSSTTR